MSSNLHVLWYMQAGECFYCGQQTWYGGRESKRDAKLRLGLTTTKDLRRRQASLEHLHRKSEGGTRAMPNVIMACVGCNSGRQTTPPLLHLAAMRGAIQPTTNGE